LKANHIELKALGYEPWLINVENVVRS
jgi:hypothetical protein